MLRSGEKIKLYFVQIARKGNENKEHTLISIHKVEEINKRGKKEKRRKTIIKGNITRGSGPAPWGQHTTLGKRWFGS